MKPLPSVLLIFHPLSVVNDHLRYPTGMNATELDFIISCCCALAFLSGQKNSYTTFPGITGPYSNICKMSAEMDSLIVIFFDPFLPVMLFKCKIN